MEHSIIEVIAELALTLGLILILAKIGGEIAVRYLHIPSVIGELLVGIIISPFALGGLSIFGLDPLFPVIVHEGERMAVERDILFIAQVAAVILLFEAGLETNKPKFIKYFKPASVVALGGVLLPFALGFGATLLFFTLQNDTFSSALLPSLFVGVAMTATSVGITARVLGDMGQIDSPEGVTVLGAAVVDDVVGIVLLSIIVALASQGSVSAAEIGLIILRAVGFLVVVVVIGSLISKYISRAILSTRSAGAAVGISISLAILTGAVAEIYFGLAMIIGAYSIGLALSDTELKHRIEKQVGYISGVLSTIFFVVIGMQVDFSTFGAGNLWLIVGFAVVLSLFGIISKFVGSGAPALLFKFNRLGASRIGFGMMPRGEVALIVAGIGLSAGVVKNDIYSVVVVMTVVTTIIAPIVLIKLFRNGKSGMHDQDSPLGRPPEEIGHT